MAVKITPPFYVSSGSTVTGVAAGAGTKRIVYAKLDGNVIDHVRIAGGTARVAEPPTDVVLVVMRNDDGTITLTTSFDPPPEPFTSLLTQPAAGDEDDRYLAYLDGELAAHIPEDGEFEIDEQDEGKTLTIRPQFTVGRGPASEGVEVPQVPNRAPTVAVSIPDQYLASGSGSAVREYIDLSLYLEDPDGDDLTFTVTENFPGVATIGTYTPSTDRWRGGASGHWLRLRPHATNTGTGSVTVTATDPDGANVTDTFTVTVTTEDPYIIDTIPDVELYTSGTEEINRHVIDLPAYFVDVEGGELTYEIADTVFVDVTLDGTILTIQSRRVLTSGTMTVTATDDEGNAASQTFGIDVVARPGAPLEPRPGDPFQTVTDTTATIRWVHASGGATRLGYRVRWYPTADGLAAGSTVATVADPDATSYTITGLEAETQYSIDVFAYNAAGESPGIRAVVTTAETLPVASILSATISGNASQDESTSQTFSVAVGGGVYDELEYAWSVDPTDLAPLSGASTATPTWTVGEVSLDRTVTINVTVTARGTGTIASAGTSATATDSFEVTVRNVVAPDLDPYPATSVALSISDNGLCTVTTTWPTDNPNAPRDSWGVRINRSGTSPVPVTGLPFESPIALATTSVTLDDALAAAGTYYAWARARSGDRRSTWVASQGVAYTPPPPNASIILFGLGAANMDELSSQTFNPTISGVYDTITFSWSHTPTNLGSLSNADTQFATYNAGTVSLNREIRIRLGITVTGTGTNAAAGTSAQTNLSTTFLVRDVPQANDPHPPVSVGLSITAAGIVTVTPEWPADDPARPRVGWGVRIATSANQSDGFTAVLIELGQQQPNPHIGDPPSITFANSLSVTSIADAGTYWAQVRARGEGLARSEWIPSSPVSWSPP